MRPIWLLLLLVPAVAASGEHVLQYQVFGHTESGTDGQVAETAVTVPLVHSWTHVSGESVLEVHASYTVQTGGETDTTADFRVVWNGTIVAECDWSLAGGSESESRQNNAIAAFCALPAFVAPGNYTVQVERTAVTGTPVTHSLTSIILHQRETVAMDIDVASALDTYLPFLFWGGLALLFLARKAFAPAIAATIMVVSALLTQEVWSFAMGVLLVLISVWIHVMAKNGVFKGVDER